MFKSANVRAVILAAVTILAGLFLAVPASADQKFEYGIDRPGGDVDLQPLAAGQNEADCRQLCFLHGNCYSWTYVKPGYQGEQAMCWLKSGLPAYQPNECCISGVMGSTWEPGIDRPGNDISSFPTGSAEECKAACDPDSSGCRAWTFDANNSTCFLKAPVPDAWPNSCCTSGLNRPDSFSF